jgi:hypothetical protein
LPEDQIPLEPLSRKRREELADALVNLLLNRKVVEQQKKATATEYNEELKALDTDIDAITKALNQPHVEYDDDGTPDPEYPTDHLERAMAGVPMANEIAAAVWSPPCAGSERVAVWFFESVLTKRAGAIQCRQ